MEGTGGSPQSISTESQNIFLGGEASLIYTIASHSLPDLYYILMGLRATLCVFKDALGLYYSLP
jgi:hypothetical protein